MKKSLDFLGFPNHIVNSDGSFFTQSRYVNGRYDKRFIHGKKLKSYVGSNGYPHITFRDGNKIKGFNVHRILGIAFIPNPLNLPQINHKDGNKLNNNLSNLEWCTYSGNVKHAYSTGLRKCQRGVNSKTAKLNPDKAKEICMSYKEGGISMIEIGKRYGISGSTVSDIISGKTWGGKKLSINEIEDFVSQNKVTKCVDLIKILKQTYGTDI